MIDPGREFETLLEGIRQQRDELRVQLNLAKAEVREQWDDLEQKWDHLNARAKLAGAEAGEAARDVVAAMTLVGEEIKEGYRRIRKFL